MSQNNITVHTCLKYEQKNKNFSKKISSCENKKNFLIFNLHKLNYLPSSKNLSQNNVTTQNLRQVIGFQKSLSQNNVTTRLGLHFKKFQLAQVNAMQNLTCSGSKPLQKTTSSPSWKNFVANHRCSQIKKENELAQVRKFSCKGFTEANKKLFSLLYPIAVGRNENQLDHVSNLSHSHITLGTKGRITTTIFIKRYNVIECMNANNNRKKSIEVDL